MKKPLRVIVGILVVGYAALRWDYYLSNYMFKKVCGPDGEIGTSIYEQVVLGEKYFTSIPPGNDLRDMDPRFLYGDKLMIDRAVFDQDYSLVPYEYIPFSSIGPISLSQTSVVRNSDGKLLGKAVSANNSQGWFSQFFVLGGAPGTHCPSGRDDQGFSYYGMDHDQLIKSIFKHKKQGA